MYLSAAVSNIAARFILCDALSQQQEQMPLGQRLLRRFSGTASTDFALPARHTPRNPPAWD